MSIFKSLFSGKPEPTPEEKIKEWKAKLRAECRQLDRTIASMSFY